MHFRGNRIIFGLFATLFMIEILISSTVSSKGSSYKVDKVKLSEETGKWAVHDTLDGLVTAAIPSIAILVPPPFGAGIAVGLGLMWSIFKKANTVANKDDKENERKKEEKNVMKNNLEIIHQVNKLEKRIVEESHRIINDLTFVIESYPRLQNFRKDLDTIELHYKNRIDYVLNSSYTGPAKDNILDELLKPAGDDRKILEAFSFNYLGSNNPAGNLHPEKFYYDIILQRLKNDELNNIDCYPQSHHFRIFKITLYIAEVLTKGYSMIIAAHYARYQELTTLKNTTVTTTLKSQLADTVNEYLNHLRILMPKAQNALQQSSREIRTCGPYTAPLGVGGYSFYYIYPPGLRGEKIRFNSKFIYAEPGNVITGVRWIEKPYGYNHEQVMCIQIQEGRLTDGFHVDEKTVKWQDGIMTLEIIELDEENGGVILEDLILPRRTFLTGVRLIAVDKKITLSVEGFEINANKETIWHDKKGGHEHKIEELKMERLHDEACDFTNNKTLVMRHQNKYYVKFQRNAGERRNMYTIPFFDTQNVETNPPAPISGIGIYHKAAEGYGGFFGFKLLSPDFTPTMDVEHLENLAQNLQFHG